MSPKLSDLRNLCNTENDQHKPSSPSDKPVESVGRRETQAGRRPSEPAEPIQENTLKPSAVAPEHCNLAAASIDRDLIAVYMLRDLKFVEYASERIKTDLFNSEQKALDLLFEIVYRKYIGCERLCTQTEVYEELDRLAASLGHLADHQQVAEVRAYAEIAFECDTEALSTDEAIDRILNPWLPVSSDYRLGEDGNAYIGDVPILSAREFQFTDRSMSVRERILALWPYDNDQQSKLDILGHDQQCLLLKSLTTHIQARPVMEKADPRPTELLEEQLASYYLTPEGCTVKAAQLIEQMAECKRGGDHKQVELLSNQLVMCLRRAGLAQINVPEPEEEDDELWPKVDLADRRQVPKVELQWLYDEAPEPAKCVIDLLYVISGRNKVMAPVLVMFVMNLASNLLGKELVGMNMGRAYYGNTAFVALLDSGSNKFFVETVRKALDSVLRQMMRGQPEAGITLDEQQQERQELRRQHGLAAGKTTTLLSVGGNINGIYKTIGATISATRLANMTSPEREAMRDELTSSMYLDPGAMILADEVTMTIQKLVGAGGGRGTMDMGEVLKMFDSGVPFNKTVGVHGWQAVEDACIGLLGCSQPNTWNQYIGEVVDADTTGLIGRIQVLNLKDCLPVKIRRKQLTQNAAIGQLELALQDLIRLVTYFKTDDGKVVCEFGVDQDGDWAGRLYQEVADQLGDRYLELVDRYGFESDAGCRGKVFWHAIKLLMAHKYYGLSTREIADIRSTGTDRVPMPEGLDALDQLVHERTHRQYFTDRLRDPELFKKYVRLIITMMEANLMNLDVDVEATKLQKKMMRFIGELGSEATPSNIRQKSPRKSYGTGTRRMNTKEIQEELSAMVEAGLIDITQNAEGQLVYYLLKNVSDQ